MIYNKSLPIKFVYPLIAFIVIGIGIHTSLRFFIANTVPLTFGSVAKSFTSWYFLLLLPAITLANIFLRFLRWSFLLRTFGCIFKIKELFIAYLTAFIGNLFPFYFPYLLRLGPLQNKYYVGFFVLLLDILIDFLAVLTLCFLVSYIQLLAVVVLFMIFLVIITLLPSKGKGKPLSSVYLFCGIIFGFCFSVLIWFVTAGSLKVVLLAFGHNLPLLTSTTLFSSSQITGTLAFIPAGIMTTGKTLIDLLGAQGLPSDISMYSVVILRSLTFWFTLLISVGAAGYYYRYNARLGRTVHQDHFDTIAEEYTEEIPEHIRTHLLEKKIGINRRFLTNSGTLRGLDIGCGQGWYLDAMRQKGYRVFGMDYSFGQVLGAARYNAGSNRGWLSQGSITDMPLHSESLDFVYSINTFHHLPSVHDQKKAIDEIYRVLKPGGICLIHEMNIKNPIFRFYMSYIFPLTKSIDAGTEIWIKGDEKILYHNFRHEDTIYQTFLPDFLPRFLFKPFTGLEKYLEGIPVVRFFSAHICVVLKKAVV